MVVILCSPASQKLSHLENIEDRDNLSENVVRILSLKLFFHICKKYTPTLSLFAQIPCLFAYIFSDCILFCKMVNYSVLIISISIPNGVYLNTNNSFTTI